MVENLLLFELWQNCDTNESIGQLNKKASNVTIIVLHIAFARKHGFEYILRII